MYVFRLCPGAYERDDDDGLGLTKAAADYIGPAEYEGADKAEVCADPATVARRRV